MIMPRKDSDDEFEPKSGRRTRAVTNTSVLDSPLRRSSRIKQPVHQEGSSPDSVSDVSSVGATRSTRRRTTTLDSGTAESGRSLRTRRNSVASDISELTETESLPDGPAKRITRRSVVGVSATDTPPSLNGRNRRTIRADSESKSTPPAGRMTRRNRASSLEPDGIDDRKIREIGTPVKSRKRASAMPSEPAVAEESDDSGHRNREGDKTVYEIDEEETETPADDTSKSSRRKSKSDVNETIEKMEVDESPVRESEDNAIERSNRENTMDDISHASKKLEDSFKDAETKKADVGSPQQISSPSKSSSYTIESILSPSAEKHDKSPGNKENEILNDSTAALLERSTKLADIDVRLMNRRSLNSAYVKTQEKRHNISVDDAHLSNNYETPTKSVADVKSELTKRSSEKFNKKDRYTVDECVVIIEPMEIDRIDRIAAANVSNKSEISKTRNDYKIVEITDEETGSKETDRKLSGEEVESNENVVIDEDVAGEESNLKISNVVSIVTNEKNEKTVKEVEITEVIEDVEAIETLQMKTKDRNVLIEEETLSEGVNDEKATMELSDVNAEPQTSISEDKAPKDGANDEELLMEPKISIAASIASNSENEALSDVANGKKTSTEPSALMDEPPASISEDETPSERVNDEKTPTEPSVLIDESRASNSEGKSPCVELKDENSSRNTLIFDGETCALNSEEKSPNNNVNNEKTSTVSSISDAELRVTNIEEKTPSESVNDEKTSTDPSDPNVETTASNTSINNENPINSDEIEDNLVKGSKSSIVTESPTSGANGEEASNVSKEQEKRKSTSNGRSSNANEQKNKSDEIEDKPTEKKIEAEPKNLQSDEDSECDGYPAFKDIPADEWTGAENGESKKNANVETNSVHSVSTECNECESDFELVVKEDSQNTEKEEEQVKSDYDSDDTVKIAIATRNSAGQKDDEEEEESASNQETPMDLSSDAEEDEEIETSANHEISKKRTSLNSSRKINETNTPLSNKNNALVADTPAKNSPVSLNASQRKSLLSVDDQSNDNSNLSMKLNSSLNNSLKKRSLNVSTRSKQNTDSDEEGEIDNAEVTTPKVVNRKSLDASGKKLKDRTLDSSKTNNSAKNTPSNAEKKVNDKNNRSLNKLALSSQCDDDDDSSDNQAESDVSQEANKTENLAKFTLKKQIRGRLSTGSTVDIFTSASDSPASPKIDKGRLNRSVNRESARKSLNERNLSKLCDSESEEEESQEDPSSSKIQLNISAKSASAKKSKINKNNSKIAQSSDSEVEVFKDTPASPDPEEEEVIEKSVKIGSVKKSRNKNTSKLTSTSSEFEVDDEISQESIKKPVKSGSAKKSKNNSILSVTSSNSTADDEESQENVNKLVKSGSAKKSIVDKNYSTIAQINSDSDVDGDMESYSSDDADISRKIPKFLFDHSSSDEDSEKSIDSDIAREMNLEGKTSLVYSDDNVPADDCMATESESSDEDDDGLDLLDFVVDDDEEEDFEDVENDLGLDDDESNESYTEQKNKPRKRIINRPADALDTDESDEEEPMNVSYTLDKSKTTKTPIKDTKLNKTQEVLESEEKLVDLNISMKNVAVKNKNLLIQSSTPKTLARQSLLLEKSTSTKETTPLNKSSITADSTTKPEISTSKKLSKSVCESVDTPTKLGSSFKLAKTPKTSLSVQQQLQTSLPADFNDSVARTNLSKTKSSKISTLNQTVVPHGSESPETRFLMKEKLNDSMPALKLQQKARALRRSLLDNLREEMQATDEVLAGIDEIQEQSAEERVSMNKEEATSEAEVSSEKKKKKKKKKKNRENANVSETPEEEITNSFIENVAEVDESTSNKKSKKLNKKKKAAELLESDETKAEDISKKKKKNKKLVEIVEKSESDDVDKKKKKKKKLAEVVEQSESDEADKKKKKKKKKKKLVEIVEQSESDEVDKKQNKKKKEKKDRIIPADITEPEVPTLRQKSRRIATQNVKKSDSDDAPETVDFTKARDTALRELRKMTESIKAGQEAKKKKHQENLSSQQERKIKISSDAAEVFGKVKTSVKRLPADFLHNLSDVVERPKKKRKVVNEEKIVPPKIIEPLHTKSGDFNVDDGYIPLSSSGGTTQFTVVNLKKAVKHSKKAVAAMNFRERMLARNPRQPISAYLMYQQKLKASGRDKPY